MVRVGVVLRSVYDLFGCHFFLLMLHRLIALFLLWVKSLPVHILREVHVGRKQTRKLILLHVCLLFCFSANVDAGRYRATL
jgi:hypothetical protein